MKRKLTLMLALLFVWTGVAWSQGVTVKGVVTSEEDGLPIVGASVLVKGTIWGIERSGFFNGQGKWAKGFENQMV